MVHYNWQRLAEGAPILIFGIILAWADYKNHKKIIASRNWPKAMGVVISVKINKYYTGKGGKRYQPIFTYHYSANGVEYKHDIIKKSTIFSDVAAYELLPVGTQLVISYNPENPKDCITEYDEENIPWFGLGLIAFGVVLILIGFIA
jgi:hypothetical protein